jgi:hypothetical protein
MRVSISYNLTYGGFCGINHVTEMSLWEKNERCLFGDILVTCLVLVRQDSGSFIQLD